MGALIVHNDLQLILTCKYASKFDMYVFERKHFHTCYLGVYFLNSNDSHRYIASLNEEHVEHAIPLVKFDQVNAL